VPFHSYLETAIPVIPSQGVGLTCPKAQGAESISARMMLQYAADPSSSVAASCKQVHKDVVTAVHNEWAHFKSAMLFDAEHHRSSFCQLPSHLEPKHLAHINDVCFAS